MKRILFLAVMGSLVIPSMVYAQIVDSTVCDILGNPQSFDGKIVRIKGTVVAGFEEFSIKDSGCNQAVNAIWLAYPQGTKGRAGPVAFLRLQLSKNHPATVPEIQRMPVSLAKNSDFKKFDGLLSTSAKTSGTCLGCVKFAVNATLIGRVDGVQQTGFLRSTSGEVTGVSGFGNLNRYRARLVLQTVADLSPQEIDYSKGESLSLGLVPLGGSFTPGTPSADQVKRGADAFGAPGEDNGVDVGFGTANEVPADDAGKSSANSPDGLVFDAVFDGGRLKGAAMQLALSHVGTHIADIRSMTPEIRDISFYGAEFRAWQTSALNAAAFGAKEMILPGGYVIFSKSWPDSDLGRNVNGGISAFLPNWAGIANVPGQ